MIANNIKGLDYKIPVSYENGIATITPEDLSNFLYLIEEKKTEPKTLYYVGQFKEEPVLRKYSYSDKVVYRVPKEESETDENESLSDSDDTEEDEKPKFKQYLIQIENPSDGVDQGQYSLFPIPMRGLRQNVYVLNEDGTLNLDEPAFKFEMITKETSDETSTDKTPTEKTTLNFDILEKNTEFYINEGEVNDYEPGDIYYNTETKVFKKLIETTYSISYYDEEYQPDVYEPYIFKGPYSHVVTSISVENGKIINITYDEDETPDGTGDKYVLVSWNLVPWPDATGGEEIPEETESEVEATAGETETVETSDPNTDLRLALKALAKDPYYTILGDEGTVKKYNIEEIKLGGFKTIQITERSWVKCDDEDTINMYINKYNGTVWTKEVK